VVAHADGDLAVVVRELDGEEVVAEVVAVLDSVLAGFVAGHDHVLGHVDGGAVLDEPAAQRLAHREQAPGLV